MIKKKYNYKQLDRNINKSGQRVYLTPNGLLTSVTTILEMTKTQKTINGLENWRNRIGHKNAEKITNDAAIVGTYMHTNIENYINNVKLSDKNNFFYVLAKKMANTIIKEGMSNVSEIYGCEISLYFENMYSGTTDCVGLWNNKLAIIDFKQSLRPKKEEWVTDYKMQLAAYAMAHNYMFNTNITTGVIMMCSQDLTYQEFIISEESFEIAKLDWILRLQKYYSNRV